VRSHSPAGRAQSRAIGAENQGARGRPLASHRPRLVACIRSRLMMAWHDMSQLERSLTNRPRPSTPPRTLGDASAERSRQDVKSSQVKSSQVHRNSLLGQCENHEDYNFTS
jgi:hypothetical protein